MLNILNNDKQNLRIKLDKELIINNLDNLFSKYENNPNKHNYTKEEYCLVEIFDYFSSHMSIMMFSMNGLDEVFNSINGALLENYKTNIEDATNNDEEWNQIFETLIYDLINIIKLQ